MIGYRGRLLIFAWAVVNLIFPVLFVPSVIVGVWLAAKRHPLFWFYVLTVGLALLLGGAAGLTVGGYAISHRL
jgi:hypothetical protein